MTAINALYLAIVILFFFIFCGLQMFLARSPKLYISFLLPALSLAVIAFFYYRSLNVDTPSLNMGNGLAMLTGLALFVTSFIIFVYTKIAKYLEHRDDLEE